MAAVMSRANQQLIRRPFFDLHDLSGNSPAWQKSVIQSSFKFPDSSSRTVSIFGLWLLLGEVRFCQ